MGGIRHQPGRDGTCQSCDSDREAAGVRTSVGMRLPGRRLGRACFDAMWTDNWWVAICSPQYRHSALPAEMK